MTANCSFKYALIILSFCLSITDMTYALDEKKDLSKGQLIYVPAYSHIYSGNKERPLLLTVTLSIRNIDPNHSIKITLVDYYETQGQLVKKHIKTPIILKKLETLRYVVPNKDTIGGSGANFLVQWESEDFVNTPIIETIMISTESAQGVSFTSRGKEIFMTE